MSQTAKNDDTIVEEMIIDEPQATVKIKVEHYEAHSNRHLRIIKNGEQEPDKEDLSVFKTMLDFVKDLTDCDSINVKL